MKALLARLAFVLALIGSVHAAPLTRDLGHGLLYHRIHQLPADLPTAEETRRQPCILDLRFVTGTVEDAAALSAWLKFHATAHAPVFVLANTGTSAPLISVITPRGTGTSIVVLGAANANFTPDIALKVSVDTERRAYDAFEHGAPAESLIAENSAKARNDEAKLAKDRQPATDNLPAAPPATTAIDATAKGDLLVDPVLQRAVQLHRALLALKKI